GPRVGVFGRWGAGARTAQAVGAHPPLPLRWVPRGPRAPCRGDYAPGWAGPSWSRGTGLGVAVRISEAVAPAEWQFRRGRWDRGRDRGRRGSRPGGHTCRLCGRLRPALALAAGFAVLGALSALGRRHLPPGADADHRDTSRAAQRGSCPSDPP